MRHIPPQINRAYDGPRPPVSVVVLTKNEEINIADCLASCAWCDDIHVLDSGSNDRTKEVALRHGVGVHTHPFESFGKQRNWAIDHIPLKHDWVFHLDADERFTPPLVAEIQRRLDQDPGVAGFHIPSMLVFMDRWLRHTGSYPAYQVRLFHKGRMRFRDYGHGQREDTTQRLPAFKNPYIHYNFSKGLEEWFDKHNRYSSLEAEQALVERAVRLQDILTDILSGDAVARRRGFKRLSFRVPCRPVIVYLYVMIARLGILDGAAGLTYARMRRIYDTMTAVKIAVLVHERRSGIPAAGPGPLPTTAPLVSPVR